MSNALVKQEQYGYTDDEIRVIKATIAPGATDAELGLFLTVAQKSGLDPFSRQIYLSERKSQDKNGNWVSKKTPETTIDGFRVIAERSGKYAGQVGPFWCGQDGQWHDVWLGSDYPSAAKVGILRTDFREPIWAIALFAEYVQTKTDGTPNSMWKKMAANQLAKCAESLGLRKAFPRDLSGFYSKEEMGQVTIEEPQGSREAQIEVMNRKLAELPAPLGPDRVAEIVDKEEAKPPAEEAAPSKPPRKRGDISFKALGDIKEQKKLLGGLSGSDKLYYEALSAFGVEHADALSTTDGRKLWKALKEMVLRLTNEDKNLKIEKERRDELTKQWERVGSDKFLETLGNAGFVSLEEMLTNATVEQETAVLRELRSL